MASSDPTDRPNGRPAFAGSVSRERWSLERLALAFADAVFGWFPFLEDFPLVIVLGSGAGIIWLAAQLPLWGFLTLIISWVSGGRLGPETYASCCIEGFVFLGGLAVIAPVSYALDNYFKELRGQRRDRR